MNLRFVKIGKIALKMLRNEALLWTSIKFEFLIILLISNLIIII